ncbi:MAG: hypothetical protein MZU95_02915 [Desulfomicrobium escambiense]|nr:hypothetical protein [Desulfomicrobium escambiense]
MGASQGAGPPVAPRGQPRRPLSTDSSICRRQGDKVLVVVADYLAGPLSFQLARFVSISPQTAGPLK